MKMPIHTVTFGSAIILPHFLHLEICVGTFDYREHICTASPDFYVDSIYT